MAYSSLWMRCSTHRGRLMKLMIRSSPLLRWAIPARHLERHHRFGRLAPIPYGYGILVGEVRIF